MISIERVILLIVLSFIASVAGLIGGVILLYKKEWAKKLASVSVPLAAGVILTLTFLDLFPEATEKIGNSAFSIILAIFIILFITERFFFYLHHHQGDDEDAPHVHEEGYTVVPLVILGDTIHNFLDGIVIGASLLVNQNLAILVSLSTFIHETPHEIADFGILLSKGWSRKRVFMANFLSSLATFPGALLAYFFAGKVDSGIGILISIAAGFFLYVASTDFLPEAVHAPRKLIFQQVVFLMIGVLVIFAIRIVFPEINH